MKVRILNCPDLRFKPYLDRATRFYLNLLVTRKRLFKYLKVTIRFTNKINVLGYCSVEKLNSRKHAREFLIEIHSRISASNILRVLAHECVHIKQYINGETNDQLNLWQGQPVNYDETDYWDQPWEIEAHGLEVGTFVKFVIQEKLWEIFDDIRNPNADISPEPFGWKTKPI